MPEAEPELIWPSLLRAPSPLKPLIYLDLNQWIYAYSGRCRPLIPADGGHRFRLKKPTCSGGPDQEISG
jgi:hypothetical protein